MCGIAGALDLSGNRDFPADCLRRMLGALFHRGPDGEGRIFAPGIALGARRLAILDPEGGAQPVTNEAGDVVAAVNGELFEHDALRSDLEGRGHRFRSRCDSELWPHLWEEHGRDLLARAKGQFAVSIWDASRRRLLLARDRVGICPLYVAERDGWLLWGSEAKALLASGLVQASADPRAIDHLFCFFCSPARRTFFGGVTSLAPGEALVAEGGRVSIFRHSDIDFPAMGEEERGDPSRLADELDAALRRAVRRRLRADVPVASYLSGGLDSNTVLAMARAERGVAPPAFSIGFDGAGTDESSLAEVSARALGAPLTVVRMDRRGVADLLPAIHAAAESPVIDTSTACLMHLAARVRAAGCKVVLTGEGADEAMAGYVWLRTEKVLRRLDALGMGVPSRAIRGAVFGLVGGRSSPPRGALASLRTAQRDVYDPFASVRESLYSGDLRATLAGHDPYEDLDLDVDRMRRWHPLNRSLHVEYRVMLPGLLLAAKGDRASMRSGVEARYPFLDDDVIDLCARLAPEYKIRGLTEKWLLRRVAARYLPERIARRTKTMFRAHLSPLVLGPGRPAWVDQLLSPDSLRRSGWFDPTAVERELARQRVLPSFLPRRLVMDGALTAVVATQLWHHLFLDGKLCEVPRWSATAPEDLPVGRVGQISPDGFIPT